jgi:hypothetical protein
MNKTLGLQLLVYSLLLAGVSFLAHHFAPNLARTTLITGLTGGTFCLVWGLRVMGGSRGKALPMITLVAVNFFLLSQMVMGWWGGGEVTSGRRTAAAMITLLFALSLGMLMRIAYAGIVFDGPTVSPPKDEGNPPHNAGKTAARVHNVKRL